MIVRHLHKVIERLSVLVQFTAEMATVSYTQVSREQVKEKLKHVRG